jgi:hypothetical protein
MYDGTPCHIVGSTSTSVRLFCGSRTPRNVVVAANDPKLAPERGELENIFKQF